MGYQSDLEIAQRCTMQPICDIARTVGIDDADIEPYGRHKAKVALSVLGQPPRGKGKLILVTAITPTPAGEGKTTTTIGLADALRRIGNSLFTVWQASRRHYRMNQTMECRTYYMAYEGTAQAKVIELIAEKHTTNHHREAGIGIIPTSRQENKEEI